MFYKVVIGCFEPLDQAGFLVIKTFAMSTYVLYQKVRLLKRFPEPLPDPPTLPQIFKGLVTRLLYHPVIANIFLLQGKEGYDLSGW